MAYVFPINEKKIVTLTDVGSVTATQVKVITQFWMWIQQQDNDSCQGFVLAVAYY